MIGIVGSAAYDVGAANPAATATAVASSSFFIEFLPYSHWTARMLTRSSGPFVR
jgi:hypothetical protein